MTLLTVSKDWEAKLPFPIIKQTIKEDFALYKPRWQLMDAMAESGGNRQAIEQHKEERDRSKADLGEAEQRAAAGDEQLLRVSLEFDLGSELPRPWLECFSIIAFSLHSQYMSRHCSP